MKDRNNFSLHKKSYSSKKISAFRTKFIGKFLLFFLYKIYSSTGKHFKEFSFLQENFLCIAKSSWIFNLFEDKNALNFCWKVILIHIEKIVTYATEIGI